MVKKPKNQWNKPELIILMRSTTEEAVLKACKLGVKWGPSGEGGSCKQCGEYPGCYNCSAQLSS